MAVRALLARRPRRPRSRLRARLCPCSLPPAADRGAAAIEYTAVAVLICTLAVALLGTTDHGRRLLAELERAVCSALDLGGCQTAPGQADDLRPEPCTTDAHEVAASIGVSVAASPSGHVRIGERVRSDGTAEVSLTRALRATADAPSPFQWGFGAGPLAEADAGVAAGVHGGASATQVWTFDSQQEADRFSDRVARAEHLHSLSENSGAFDALGARLVGSAADLFAADDAGASLPPPDRREVSVTGGAHLTGGAGAAVGPRRPVRAARDDGRDGRGGEGSDTAGTDRAPPAAPSGPDPASVTTDSPDLLRLVSAGAEGNAAVTDTVDDSHNTTSRTVAFEFAESGEAGPLMPESVLAPEDTRNRVTRASLTTTRDRDTGRLTEIMIKTVNAGDERGRVVGTTRLGVTDTNRATVRRWLADRKPLLALSFLGTTGRPKDLTSPQATPDAVSGFDRLLYREGTYSTVRYAADSDGRDFAAEATLGGLSFGGSTGWESATHTATGARYLAPPDAEGRRELVPFEECAG